MATLNIRQLPDTVHAQLRVRAAHNGRSMEAEARDILARACTDAGAYAATEGSSLVRDAAGADALTVVLDPVVAEAARQQAARFGTTVEDWIRQVIDRQVAADAQRWCEDLFAKMDAAGGNSHGRRWNRDDLYDR